MGAPGSEDQFQANELFINGQATIGGPVTVAAGQFVRHDGTLTGDGTIASPLHVAGGGPAPTVNANAIAFGAAAPPMAAIISDPLLTAGALDAFGRPGYHDARTNSILRLGADTADGDAINADSEGMVVYHPTGDQLGRFKADRFGLTRSSDSSKYYFRVDETALFYRADPPGGVLWFNIDRTTGEVAIAQDVVLGATLDPAALAGNTKIYSKLVAGVAQLFARASDGTITQLTPATGGGPTNPGNTVDFFEDFIESTSFGHAEVGPSPVAVLSPGGPPPLVGGAAQLTVQSLTDSVVIFPGAFLPGGTPPAGVVFGADHDLDWYGMFDTVPTLVEDFAMFMGMVLVPTTGAFSGAQVGFIANANTFGNSNWWVYKGGAIPGVGTVDTGVPIDTLPHRFSYRYVFATNTITFLIDGVPVHVGTVTVPPVSSMPAAKLTYTNGGASSCDGFMDYVRLRFPTTVR